MTKPLATIRQVQPAGTTDDRIYDGEDMVFEIRDYHGVIGPQQWARYIHGPGSDQPLAMELYAPGAQPTPGTGQVFYYHADGEGSIRLLTNASGAVVNRYEYDSYGKRLQAVEAVRQPYTWKGREYIAGLDMYYNRMRFYDPQMGRFIQEDPIHFDGGDTNLFAFTWGNPVNWNDPSGLTPGGEYGGTSSGITGGLLGGGVVASASAFATKASTAAALAGPKLASVSLLAGRISCTFFILSDALAFMNDPGVDTGVSLAVNVAECGVRPGPKTPKPKPKPEPKACPYVPGNNSFAADTMVWIKDGLKAIQDIREGDEVLAWDPAKNTPTLKPVLGTTSRVTDDIYRLTLVDAGGKRTTTIVTGNHPYLLAASAANDNDPLRLAANDNGAVDPSILRIVPGGDWKIVRFLKPGDQIRTALNGRVARDANGGLSLIEGPGNDLLTVVSVELDRSPRQVYNFEVADLHSYAVGELGEWVHNGHGAYIIKLPGGQYYIGKGDAYRARRSANKHGGTIERLIPASCDRQSFKREHWLIQFFGGINGGNLVNKRNSPGAKM